MARAGSIRSTSASEDRRPAATRRTSAGTPHREPSVRCRGTDGVVTAIRLILGLGVTFACFAIAGRRFWWLRRLIGTGVPAPGRWQGFGSRAEAELVEVAGQKKLLRWTVPGIAHFFTMWGFTILMLTILEAYGALFS